MSVFDNEFKSYRKKKKGGQRNTRHVEMTTYPIGDKTKKSKYEKANISRKMPEMR